jgi:hypothetical protein
MLHTGPKGAVFGAAKVVHMSLPQAQPHNKLLKSIEWFSVNNAVQGPAECIRAGSAGVESVLHGCCTALQAMPTAHQMVGSRQHGAWGGGPIQWGMGPPLHGAWGPQGTSWCHPVGAAAWGGLQAIPCHEVQTIEGMWQLQITEGKEYGKQGSRVHLGPGRQAPCEQ